MRETPNSTPTPGNAKYYLAHSGSGNLPALLVASAALDELRYAYIEANQMLPSRGLEVGGLLFGRTAWVPTGARAAYIDGFGTIEIEHANGPSFVLSENDLSAIRAEMDKAKEEGREVLGWWRTDTRSDEFRFAAEDISLSSRLFGKESRLDLLLRSEPEKPLRALVRAEGETFAASSQEFPFERERMKTAELPAAIPDPPKAKETRWVDSIPSEVADDVTKPVDEPADAAAEPMPLVAARHAGRNGEPENGGGRFQSRKVFILALMAICAVLIAYLGYREFLNETRTEQPGEQNAAIADAEAPTLIALRATREGEGLRLEWDPGEPALRDATSATLLIRDGGDESQVNLSAAELANGSYTVTPRSNDLRIELETVGASGKGRAVLQVLLPASPDEPMGPAAPETSGEAATTLAENQAKPSPAKVANARPPAAKPKQPARSTAPVKPGQAKPTASETLPWQESPPSAGGTGDAAGAPNADGEQPSSAAAEAKRPTSLPAQSPPDLGPSCQSSVSLVAYFEPRSAFGFLKAIPRAVGIGGKPDGDEEGFEAPKLAQTPCPDLKGRRFVQKPENLEFLVEVSPEGSVNAVKPTGDASGTLVADHVRQTLQNWRFEPAMLKNKPVRSEVQVRMKLRYPSGVYGSDAQ